MRFSSVIFVIAPGVLCFGQGPACVWPPQKGSYLNTFSCELCDPPSYNGHECKRSKGITNQEQTACVCNMCDSIHESNTGECVGMTYKGNLNTDYWELATPSDIASLGWHCSLAGLRSRLTLHANLSEEEWKPQADQMSSSWRKYAGVRCSPVAHGPNGDLDSPKGAVSLDQCQRSCDPEDACQGITFEASSGKCQLHTNINIARCDHGGSSAKGHDTYTKWSRYPGYRCYGGNDGTELKMSRGKVGIISLDECKAECESSSGCQGISIDPATGRCFQFEDITQLHCDYHSQATLASTESSVQSAADHATYMRPGCPDCYAYHTQMTSHIAVLRDGKLTYNNGGAPHKLGRGDKCHAHPRYGLIGTDRLQKPSTVKTVGECCDLCHETIGCNGWSMDLEEAACSLFAGGPGMQFSFCGHKCYSGVRSEIRELMV